jgi:hypothetical protein
LELLLELFLHFSTGLGVSQLFLGDNILELQIILDDESGWQKVVVVDKLDEGLESTFSIKLLLAHAFGDLSWGTFNSDHESVGELSVLHATFNEILRSANTAYLLCFIDLFHNDGLLACSSSGEKNNNSAFFHAKQNIGK